MSNLLADWQNALVELLQQPTPTGLGIVILRGRRDVGSSERDLGCVFSDGWQETRDVNFVNPTMYVRAWLRLAGDITEDTPADPTDLYQLAFTIAALLKPHQTTLVDDLYWSLNRMRIEPQILGVEARLVGWTGNPAML